MKRLLGKCQLSVFAVVHHSLGDIEHESQMAQRKLVRTCFLVAIAVVVVLVVVVVVVVVVLFVVVVFVVVVVNIVVVVVNVAVAVFVFLLLPPCFPRLIPQVQLELSSNSTAWATLGFRSCDFSQINKHCAWPRFVFGNCGTEHVPIRTRID